VDVVSPLKSSQVKIDGVSGKPFGSGIDTPTFDRIWNLDIDEGPPNLPSTLGPRDIALKKDFADSNSLDVGDTLNVTTPIGMKPDLRVTGIYEDKSGLVGDFIVPGSVIARQFGQRDDDLQFVALRAGANVDDVKAGVDRVLDQRFPVAEAQTQAEFKDSITGSVDQFLALIYALLSLSVIVSLFGIVNTLVLSIHERTRELGMMRAIGTPRRLVRRIVRYESVITALIGAALGLVLGFILGVVTTVALEDEGFILSIPIASLIVFAVLAVLAGVLAAIPPARRASRLNVLEALAYE
jgi:putative ABC transport system permease protein